MYTHLYREPNCKTHHLKKNSLLPFHLAVLFVVEHLLNNCPEISFRYFQPGLNKNSSFGPQSRLQKPQNQRIKRISTKIVKVLHLADLIANRPLKSAGQSRLGKGRLLLHLAEIRKIGFWPKISFSEGGGNKGGVVLNGSDT